MGSRLRGFDLSNTDVFDRIYVSLDRSAIESILRTTFSADMYGSMFYTYGFELDSGLFEYLRTLYGSADVVGYAGRFVRGRYSRHLDFVRGSELSGKSFKYWNSFLGCSVKTRQEEFLRLYLLRFLGISGFSAGVLSLSAGYVPFC